MQSKRLVKNRVNDNISGNKGLYSITNELYKDILNDMNPNEILSLFGHADQYNEFYDVLYQSKLDIAYIDKEYIFDKILETKNVDLINKALSFEPQYQAKAYEFLKNSDDYVFICEFIYGVNFDWNPYLEFLKYLDLGSIDLKILWNKVIRNNELNLKNMTELLDDEKFFILRIMYLINLGVKFKVSGMYIVNHKLGLCCFINEIKKIDENFYVRNITRLEKDYYKSIIPSKSPQISFDDLDLGNKQKDPRKSLTNN